MVESAEKRLGVLRQSVDVFKNEAQKLQERAGEAEKEFRSGRDKLRATSRELQRLWISMGRAETQASGLKELLLDLPTRDSIRLRSEMATIAADARQQKVVLSKGMGRIGRLGVS
eukprot:TRINITY_DN1407_c0_g1_i1.p2 TRINITY_DN1407_c0_g1~~TRINITY_DN1407_c0_g1_i1.p2  ORF type:complete len:115 (-),score=30.84 TRINITY_DN1407_c0_g1_i1:241-585(-)